MYKEGVPGTVSVRNTVYLRSFNLSTNLICFEWTRPFLDDSHDLPAPDTFPLATSSATENEEILRCKSDMLEQLRRQLEQLSTAKEKMDTCKDMYVPGFEANLGNAEGIWKELTCLPFVLYGVFLRALIKADAMPGDDLACAITVVAMALRKAEDENKHVNEFAFLTEVVTQFLSVPESASPSELLEQAFCLSLYGVMSPIGEWFDLEEEDYRTAIWCYDKAQEMVNAAPFPLGGAVPHANLMFVDTMNTGVACRRMGDYLSAATY